MMWFASATNLHPWFPKCRSWHTSGGNNDNTVSSVSMPAILRPLPAKCAIQGGHFQSTKWKLSFTIISKPTKKKGFENKIHWMSQNSHFEYHSPHLQDDIAVRRKVHWPGHWSLRNDLRRLNDLRPARSVPSLVRGLDGLIPGLPTLVEQLALTSQWRSEELGAKLENQKTISPGVIPNSVWGTMQAKTICAHVFSNSWGSKLMFWNIRCYYVRITRDDGYVFHKCYPKIKFPETLPEPESEPSKLTGYCPKHSP